MRKKLKEHHITSEYSSFLEENMSTKVGEEVHGDSD